MPRKVWDTEADWRAAYEIKIRDPQHPLFGQKIGYGRLWAGRVDGPYDDELTRFNRRVSRLATDSDALFAINATDRILIGGCGLGFLMDAFHDAGFPNVWGIDNSPHVASRRPSESRGTTLFVQNDFRGGGQARAQLRILTGDDVFKWIITECVLESYEDIEIPALLDASEVVLDPVESPGNIIHLVQSVGDPTNPDRSISPVFQQKTLTEWKAIRTSHSWVDTVGFEVG